MIANVVLLLITRFVQFIGLILFVISKTCWQNRRWNRSELIMGTMPCVIGGPFSENCHCQLQKQTTLTPCCAGVRDFRADTR